MTSSRPLLVSLFCSTTTLDRVFSLLVTHLELVLLFLRCSFSLIASGFGLKRLFPWYEMPNLNFDPGSGLAILNISGNVFESRLFKILLIMPILIVPPSSFIMCFGFNVFSVVSKKTSLFRS